MKNRFNIKKIAFLALCISAALLLSYVESVLPPIYPAIPGIKIGLPNVMIIFVLYRFGLPAASAVSFLRILISSLLFGNAVTFAYSVSGALLSLLVMALLRKLDFLSTVGVSVAGGITHNLGQILVAMLLLKTAEIGYYMIILAITGTVAGIVIGLCGVLMIKRIPPIKF